MAEPPAAAAHAPGAAEQQQQAGAPQLAVVQVLVRFTPEEQRWERRPQEAPPQPDEEDAARLSTEQLQALGEDGGQVLRWPLAEAVCAPLLAGPRPSAWFLCSVCPSLRMPRLMKMH